MTDMTLQDALAEVQGDITGPTYDPDTFVADGWSDRQSHCIATILNAVASGDLIPRADAQLAVALVVEQAAALHDEAEAEDIRALAPADALAEVQALRAERDGWMETAAMHLTAEQAFLSWLRAAGEHMRAEGVTVCDDGQDSGGILAAKVPECAALLKARAEAAEAKLATLVETATPYVQPVQNADYGRQLRQHEALVAALAAAKGDTP